MQKKKIKNVMEAKNSLQSHNWPLHEKKNGFACSVLPFEENI